MGQAYSVPWPREVRYQHLPPESGPPCAPRQLGMQHIPVIRFDVSNAQGDLGKRYKRCIKRRYKRSLKRSGRRYYNRPITPHHNPSNPKCRTVDNPRLDEASSHSFHAIELVHSTKSQMVVQLLVRDYDLYLPAFRRLSEDGVWSSWYRCSDQFLPDHFRAVDMGISAQHLHESTIGGTLCLDDMFFRLAKYPENTHDKAGLRRALLRAAVLFCEALRLGHVFIEILERFLARADEATPLPDLFWLWIRAWGNLSEFALNTGKDGGVLDKLEFAKQCESKGISTFRDLIGREDSVLMVLMRKDDVLLPNSKIPRGLRWRRRPGADVLEIPPEFDEDDNLDNV